MNNHEKQRDGAILRYLKILFFAAIAPIYDCSIRMLLPMKIVSGQHLKLTTIYDIQAPIRRDTYEEEVPGLQLLIGKEE